jgi:hypothetical protein
MADPEALSTEAVEAVVIPDGEGGAAVVVEVPAETIEEPAPSSDAVEIARIEADKDITIAAIHAETETAAIEARSETDAEVANLRERNAWLEAEMNTKEQALAEARAEVERLTPPPLPPETETTEVVAVLDPETLATDTSETPTEPLPETPTEAPSESADGAPVAEAEAAVVAVRRRVTRLL